MPRGVYVRGGSTDVVESKDLPDVAIPVSGDVSRDDVKIQEVEVHANMADFNAKAEELKFMEEPVTVHIHESTNPNDETYVLCRVSGEDVFPGNPYLKRGQQYTIKRKFVLNLLTAKTVSFSQPFKGEANDRANVLRPHAAVRYPFSVISDQNPKGAKWLAQLMGS